MLDEIYIESLFRDFDSYYSSLDAELTKLRQKISKKMYSLLRVTLCRQARRMDYDGLIALLNE